MKILATLGESSQQIAPAHFDQITEATNDELRECLVALKEAQETIKTSLEVKAILDRCKEGPPRQRRIRLEQNVELISSNWDSFHGWSAGRLHRLLLSPKPDVILIATNDGVRDCLRDRMAETPVSNVFLTTLRKLLPEETPLVQRLAGPEDEDTKCAAPQRTYSMNEELPSSVPLKRDWPFDDSVNFEPEQQVLECDIQQTYTDPTYALYEDIWQHSMPYGEVLTSDSRLPAHNRNADE